MFYFMNGMPACLNEYCKIWPGTRRSPKWAKRWLRKKNLSQNHSPSGLNDVIELLLTGIGIEHMVFSLLLRAKSLRRSLHRESLKKIILDECCTEGGRGFGMGWMVILEWRGK